MVAISKAVVSKAGVREKSKFVYDHDYASSFGFGEIQPTHCVLCPTPDESHDIKYSTIIRLSPLVKPMFGRAQFRTTSHFVAMKDICPNYEHILSRVSASQYAPNATTMSERLDWKFPTITQSFLSFLICKKNFSTLLGASRTGLNQINSPWSPFSSTSFTLTFLKIFFKDIASSDYSSNDFLASNEVLGYKISPTDCDFRIFGKYNTDDRLLCVKLREKGKRLMKVLTGLGYKFSFTSNLELNLLPMIAFYKCYFDEYNLVQWQNWETTNAYKIIKFFETKGCSFDLHFGSNVLFDRTEFLGYFEGLLDDLSECWYSENMNYVSANYPLSGGALPGVVPDSQRLADLRIPQGSNMQPMSVVMDDYSTPEIYGHPVLSVVNAMSLEVLQKSYISVNRDSAIGNCIRDRLIAKGYAKYVDECESSFIGSQVQPIQISDVDATASGDGVEFGMTTGKGVQYTESKNISYTNKEIGYIITMACITPISNVVNALDPTLLGTDIYTFYNPDYDSLAMEQTVRGSIGHLEGTAVSSLTPIDDETVFGYMPRYSGYKTCPSNVLNGEMCMASRRKEWLPYTLDQIIIENETQYTDLDPSTGSFKSNDTDNNGWLMPSAGPDWRYPTNRRWKGNFNRVFLNEGGNYQFGNAWSADDGNAVEPMYDNFMCHIIVDHFAYKRMLPIAESYDAIDYQENSGLMTVER